MKEIFGKTIPAIIKDPFDVKCIEEISLKAERSWFGGKRSFIFYGRVDFKNGDTEGTQRFDANNLSELFTKVA